MLQCWAVLTDAMIGSDYLSLLLNILGGILFILIWQNNLLARRTLLAGIRKYSFARNACRYRGNIVKNLCYEEIEKDTNI